MLAAAPPVIQASAVIYFGAITVAVGTIMVFMGYLNARVAPNPARKLGVFGVLVAGAGTVVAFYSAFHQYAEEHAELADWAFGITLVITVALGVWTWRNFKAGSQHDACQGKDKKHCHQCCPCQCERGRRLAGDE